MSEELVNAFIAPASKIWRLEFGYELDLKRTESAVSQITTEDVTAYFIVTGDAPGNVLYGFSIGTAKLLAGMMIGQKITYLDEVATSALGELANMISMHAVAALSEAGFECRFQPPLLLSPAGTRMAYMHNPHIKATFSSTIGNLILHVGLYTGNTDDSMDWLRQRMR